MIDSPLTEFEDLSVDSTPQIIELAKKKSPMARDGKSNGRWKGGVSKTYYRKKAGAKKGELVHHKDGNKKNSSRSNLKVIKPAKGTSARGMHNKKHDRVNDRIKK